MRDKSTPRRWRFRLRSLILAIGVLSVFLAMTISGGRSRVMLRHSESRGGAAIYGRHYGWPVPYLRVPTGNHAGKLPADVFVPGLIIDLVLAVVLVAAVLWALAALRKRGPKSESKVGSDGI